MQGLPIWVVLLTRAVWITASTVQALAGVFGFISTGRRRNSDSQSVLAIEAGEKGWESIEFHEIQQSAEEFLSPDQVLPFQISPELSYLKQFRANISSRQISHFFFDPRTSSQGFLKGIAEAIAVGAILAHRNITPIAFGTDVSHRLWRMKIVAVTASKGVCLSLISPRKVKSFFPHNRIVGPVIMPLSCRTFESLQDSTTDGSTSTRIEIGFIGSLYEPRTSVLREINELLNDRGHQLEIFGRQLGQPKEDAESYWASLMSTRILVTTTSQVKASGFDFRELNQLVYRCTEALAAGAILVMEKVSDAEKIFTDDKEVMTFETPREATNKILKILDDRVLEDRLRLAGQRKVRALIEANTFWRQIDGALGPNGFRR